MAGLAAPRIHVLLVGVSDYSTATGGKLPDLHSHADVGMIRGALEARFGTPECDITVLTQPKETTREAILRAFGSALVEPTRPGDVVFFHFSGHGTRRIDPESPESEEADGLDEVVVTYSSGRREEISDDEIRGLIDKLRAKKPANITLSFDCGFGGASSKAGRLTLRGRDLDDGTSATKGSEIFGDFCGGPFETRNELGLAPEVVVVSACRSSQTAAEIETANGKPAGILAWALATTIADCRGSATNQDIAGRLTNLISVRRPGQSPLLMGTPDSPFLGGLPHLRPGQAADRRLGYNWSPLRVDVSGVPSKTRAELSAELEALGYATPRREACGMWDLRIREAAKNGSLVLECEDGSELIQVSGKQVVQELVARVTGEASWRYAHSLGQRAGGGFASSLVPMGGKDGSVLPWPSVYANQPLFSQGDYANVVVEGAPESRCLTLIDVQRDGLLGPVDEWEKGRFVRFNSDSTGVEAALVVASSEPVTVDLSPGRSTPFALKAGGALLGDGDYSAACSTFYVLEAGWHEHAATELGRLGLGSGNAAAVLASAEIQRSLLEVVSNIRGLLGEPQPGGGEVLDNTDMGMDSDQLIASARSHKGMPDVLALANEVDARCPVDHKAAIERGKPRKWHYLTINLPSRGSYDAVRTIKEDDAVTVSVRAESDALLEIRVSGPGGLSRLTAPGGKGTVAAKSGRGHVAADAKATADEELTITITNLGSTDQHVQLVVK